METQLRKVKLDYGPLDRAKSRKEITRQFSVICNHLIKLIDSGKVSLQSGAYTIAGMMFRRNVARDWELYDICLQASELELPKKMVKDAAKKWAQLKRSIAALAKEGKKDYPRSA